MDTPKSCHDLNPNCPYLYIPKHTEGSSERVKIIICQFLNVPLQFTRERKEWIQINITNITPDWECPYWQQGRKEGKYSSVQTTIGK
ncbi:MAG: hypothetical protein JXA68_00270 [Ignavibacteriales bacterium]|nr:hypothetical protein [Ignavibacteriales bacterium]